jgi:high-affinity Fe2+/Pb2+ permease
MSLCGFAIYSTWKDRKTISTMSMKWLRFSIIWNVFVLFVCATLFIYVCLQTERKRADWISGCYAILQGFRTWSQACRERRAWNMAVVQGIMES